MSDVVLEVRNLKTHFHTDEGVVPAVDGVDFTLKKGKTLCVVGESGCGKSVTAYTVMRLIPMPPGKVESGEILYKGKDLVKLTENEMPVRMVLKKFHLVSNFPRSTLNIW